MTACTDVKPGFDGGKIICRCSEAGPVYGSNPYGGQSRLCAAAKHASIIPLSGGEFVVIRVNRTELPSKALQQCGYGSTRNGITSTATSDATVVLVLKSFRDSFSPVPTKTVYHGATKEAAASIAEKGFLLSTSDKRLGRGIYFAESPQLALAVSELRSAAGITVLVCQVDLGRCLEQPNSEASKDWHSAYDSTSSIHPPWLGQSNQREFCVKHPEQVRSVTVWQGAGTSAQLLKLAESVLGDRLMQ